MNNYKNCWTVYCHTTPSGKRYIGITCKKNLNKRWKNGNGYRKNTPFGKAIEKYGWDNIKHEILDTYLDEFEAKCLEEYYIFSFRTFVGFSDCNGYNCTLGGEGTVGLEPSEQKKHRISEKLKGIPKCDETKRRMSESLKGKPKLNKCKTSPFKDKHHSEETRIRISESKKGTIPWNKGKKCKPRTEEEKMNISASLKGKNKGKKLVMIDGKRHYE